MSKCCTRDENISQDEAKGPVRDVDVDVDEGDDDSPCEEEWYVQWKDESTHVDQVSLSLSLSVLRLIDALPSADACPPTLRS